MGVSRRSGTPGELRGFAGTSTEILSLPGRLVVPGFQDAHVHPAFGGRNLLRVNLDHVATVEDYLESIATYAAAQPRRGVDHGGRMGDVPVPRRRAP